MRHCFPFYNGYLEILIRDGYVTRLRYVDSCDVGYQDVDHPFFRLIEDYVAGREVDFQGVKIRYPFGTVFERKVWNIVREIPYGVVRSYGWVAERVGGKRFSRAVGNALSKNPIMIVVPCHRIIRFDGSLGGFTSIGGIDLKKYLLRLEGVL